MGCFDIELEKSVLGTMLSEPDSLHEAMAIIKNYDIFQSTANQYVFISIQQLFSKSLPVDIKTVTVKAREIGKLDEIGGAYYISALTTNTIYSSIEFHCRKIIEFYVKRKSAELGTRIINTASDPTSDAIELIDVFQNELTGLNSYLIGEEFEYDLASSVDATMKILTTPRESKITGIPTGNGDLSEAFSGWNKGRYYILCGRPSHFKTTFEIETALTCAYEGYEVVIMTPDQSEFDLHQKFISRISGVDGRKIQNQTCTSGEWIAIDEAAKKLKQLPIYINDKAAQSPYYIKIVSGERKRKTAAKKGLGLIIVDHLHILNADGKYGGEETKISSISKGLKTIAHELQIPLLALCHLNRESEGRDNKRPQLSDLRYSGAIEQDADGVFYSYNPWMYYEISERDPDYSYIDPNDYPNLVEKGILKNKLGMTGIRTLDLVNKSTGEFTKYARAVTATQEQPKLKFEDVPF